MNGLDKQAERVYAAESSVWWGLKFRSLSEAQVYVDGVISTSVWKKRRPDVTSIEVTSPRKLGLSSERGTVSYRGDRVYLSLPKHALNQRYVLHELAHVLAYRYGEEYHGGRFARAYLIMLGCFMGLDHARTLRLSFALNNVEWGGSSPAQR